MKRLTAAALLLALSLVAHAKPAAVVKAEAAVCEEVRTASIDIMAMRQLGHNKKDVMAPVTTEFLRKAINEAWDIPIELKKDDKIDVMVEFSQKQRNDCLTKYDNEV